MEKGYGTHQQRRYHAVCSTMQYAEKRVREERGPGDKRRGGGGIQSDQISSKKGLLPQCSIAYGNQQSGHPTNYKSPTYTLGP